MNRPILFSLCFSLVFLVGLRGQSGTAGPVQQEDSLMLQIDQLKHRLELLEKSRPDQEKQKIQDLLNQAKDLADDKKKSVNEHIKFHSGLRQQSALNPNISVGGEFYFALGKSGSDLNRLPSETDWGTGQLFFREVELGIESALDPFSRGKVFIGFDGDAVSVEEAYITWLNCPLNMNLKLGVFKNQFGKLNRVHTHALPQFDRPRVLVQFFGKETLHGTGIGGNFLLPSLWAQVQELDLELISGGNGFSFTPESQHKLIFVSHFKNYYDLNRSTYLEIGLSGAAGDHNVAGMQSLVGGLDMTLKWQPPGRMKYAGLEWITEMLFSHRETHQDWENGWGGFTSVQMRTGPRTVISGRLDYTQLPSNPSLFERGFALALDYWQSEFVFIRLQYTFLDRNFDKNDRRLILHTCWAMGPHKHEAY
jgi:hypothetical protein